MDFAASLKFLGLKTVGTEAQHSRPIQTDPNPRRPYLSASSIANISAKRPTVASASLKVSQPRRPVAAV